MKIAKRMDEAKKREVDRGWWGHVENIDKDGHVRASIIL